MKRIERLYNKYFNNRVDKVTLSSILAYGGCIILLSLLLLTGSDTILNSIVNRVTESMPFYIPVLIGMFPIVRYYQIILGRDILEEIIPKDYNYRILDVIKLYVNFALVFIILLIIHRVLLTTIIMVSNDGAVGITDVINYTFISQILSVSSLILLGLSFIGQDIFKCSKKSNLFIIICICAYMYMTRSSWLIGLFIPKSDINHISISIVKILANTVLSVIIGRFIFNNIGKVKFGKS